MTADNRLQNGVEIRVSPALTANDAIAEHMPESFFPSIFETTLRCAADDFPIELINGERRHDGSGGGSGISFIVLDNS